MDTITAARTAATEAFREKLGPALDTVEEKARQARRAIVKGRYVAEDLAHETTLQVRRRPLMAIAIATGAGALAGCIIGFALGWRSHGREEE
jgi:ElaB/YqjD/DUF883 family membrane-anchored ribosome-binding protein